MEYLSILLMYTAAIGVLDTFCTLLSVLPASLLTDNGRATNDTCPALSFHRDESVFVSTVQFTAAIAGKKILSEEEGKFLISFHDRRFAPDTNHQVCWMNCEYKFPGRPA